MTYDLFIGDRTFSSWSLRGWLMLEKFGLPYRTHMVGLYSGTMRDDLADLFPARTVPAMRTPEGGILTDSLAMAETLVEAHPGTGLYPTGPKARAAARSMVAEMHSGFPALRAECPCILSHTYRGFTVSPAVRKDIARIEALWDHARSLSTGDGPWLFGDYSLADVFYAPVAMRFVTYGLAEGDFARTYCNTHLADPAIASWRADAARERHDPFPYDIAGEKAPWPKRI